MTSLERLLAETHRIQKISHDWEELRKQAEAAQRIGTSAWRDMLTPPQPIPEDRTRDAYELAIKRWTAAVQGAWGKAVDDLVACSVPAVRIRVTNRNQTFLTGLELKVHLEGSVRGLERQNIHGRLRRSDLGAAGGTTHMGAPRAGVLPWHDHLPEQPASGSGKE